MKKQITIIYNGNFSHRKVVCDIQPDDTLIIKENIEIKNFKVEPITNKFSNVQTKPGVGDLFASITQLFGFKPCAPCNKRKKYLNEKTPIWISKVLERLYNGKKKNNK